MDEERFELGGVFLESKARSIFCLCVFEADRPIPDSPQITVSNSSTLNNIFVVQIDGVLTPPKDITAVLSDPSNNLTSLAGIASTIIIPGFNANGTNATIGAALGADSTKGYTLFAPNNDALAAASASLSSLSTNQAALLALFGNQVTLLSYFFFFSNSLLILLFRPSPGCSISTAPRTTPRLSSRPTLPRRSSQIQGRNSPSPVIPLAHT